MSVDCVIALDTPDRKTALAWVDALLPVRSKQTVFKVGLELFTSQGPSIAQEIRKRGARLFLDLKLHDIPNTVAKATAAARELDAELLTLHAAGGRAMWGAAVAEAREMRLLAVTVLTSFDDRSWAEASLTQDTVAESVTAWAAASQRWGASGWVCSGHELSLLPQGGYRLVPGIRLPGAAANDQARVMTPGDAARAGASGLVLGRSLLGSRDPVSTLQTIFVELDAVSK